MSDSDTYPVPKELEVAIDNLLTETTPYTLANILETAIYAADVGKSNSDFRYNIANRLWYLFLEYAPVGEDSDLYRLRYGRLMGDIDKQLSHIMRLPKDSDVNDFEWTKLTWLLEDQQKIVS